jgi:hypothetical protein
MRVMRRNINYFAQHLARYYLNIDDYGFPFVLYFVYSIAGNETVALYLALAFNSGVIALSTYYLYKLLIILNIKLALSRFFSACWGFSPFLFVTAAVGLKENFFCLLILSSFYYMYRYKMKRDIYSLLLCLFTILCCIFFRYAIPVMLIISFAILLLVDWKNRKRVLIFLFMLLFAGSLALNIIFTYIFPVSLDFVLEVTQGRMRGTSGSAFFKWATLIISALIGPFPNFNRLNSYAILFNGGLLFKVLFSFPLWIGIWRIIKSFDYRYYPVVAYVGMGLIMVILSGVSLDMRYQITFFPVMLPMIVYGISNEVKRNLLKTKMLYGSYFFLSVFLIIIYNNR